jgi:23S rRNA (adenine2503-C2)-methyltransferase
MAFSPRRITVSTSGYPERIRDFAARGRGYEIAVSLHAAEPELRKELVPTAQHAPGALVGAAQDYHEKTGREPTFEVVLLEGRNDAERDAYAMVKLLRRVRCKVNIIPWNPVPELAGELHSPSEPRVARYQRILEEGGIKVHRPPASRSRPGCGVWAATPAQSVAASSQGLAEAPVTGPAGVVCRLC